MFCSLGLCTGSSQHPWAGHPQISSTALQTHRFKPSSKHTSRSSCPKQTSTLFPLPHCASFTVSFAQGRDLELTGDSSSLHTHIQTCSKSEISLSYPHAPLAVDRPYPGQLHWLPPWPQEPLCSTHCDLFQWFHIISPIFLCFPVFLGTQTSCHGIYWSSLSLAHFSISCSMVHPSSLCCRHTCHHLHTH